MIYSSPRGCLFRNTDACRWLAAKHIRFHGPWRQFAHTRQLSRSSQTRAPLLQKDFEIEILRRGPGYLVVNKPHDLRMETPRRRQRDSVANQEQTSEDLNVEALLRAKPDCQFETFRSVGRLDFGTSGALFVAAWRRISAEANLLWESRRVAKVYLALVWGEMPLSVVHCNARICKPSPGSTRMRLAGSRQEGHEAFTVARPIRHCRLQETPCTLVELRPITGRRHQLRLHCVALGYPIVGDVAYAIDRRLDWRYEDVPAVPRMMLHCWQLRVPLQDCLVEAVAPDPFSGMVDEQLSPMAPEESVLIGDGSVTVRIGENQPWETFDGGLGEGIVDDTHWDQPARARKIYGRPYGPAEFDERAAMARDSHK